jgi:hypothetical protein
MRDIDNNIQKNYGNDKIKLFSLSSSHFSRIVRNFFALYQHIYIRFKNCTYFDISCLPEYLFHVDLRLDHQSNCSSFEFYLFNDISKDVKLILHFFIYIKMSIKN